MSAKAAVSPLIAKYSVRSSGDAELVAVVVVVEDVVVEDVVAVAGAVVGSA
jgi:hypothetical protein